MKRQAASVDDKTNSTAAAIRPANAAAFAAAMRDT